MLSSLVFVLALCNIFQACADTSFKHVRRQLPFSNTTISTPNVTPFGISPSSSFQPATLSASTSSRASSSSEVSTSSRASMSSRAILSEDPNNGTDSVPCTGCVLQAHIRATLTYDFDVEHVSGTVEVVPYVTVFPNTTITSWSTIQHVPTAALGSNQTSVVADFGGLSTELTWEHDGLTLTYPTTYISFVLGEIFGGVPMPTTTQADLEFCGRASLDQPPAVTPPPNSDLVYPIEQAQSSHYPFSLPAKLIDFFAAQPSVTELFGTNDLHTCTQSYPGFAFFTQTNQVAVAKTSVLVLTTQTGAPIVRTADAPRVDPVPTPVPVDTPPPPAGHVEDVSTVPLVAPLADSQVEGSGAGNTASPPAQSTGGVVAAIVNVLLGPAASGGAGATLVAAEPSPGVEPGSNANPPAGSQGQVPTGGGGAVADAIISAIGGGSPTTIAVPNAQNTQPPPPGVVNVGGQTAAVDSAGNLVVGTATVRAGGPALTVDGTVISLSTNNAGNTVVVGNGVPTPLPAAQTPVLTVGSQVLTANTAGSFVVGSSTLSVNGPAVTVDGTTISLATNNAGATVAIVNGKTSSLATATTAPVITFGGQTITATTSGSSTFFVVDGTTLTLGQVATIRGSLVTAPAASASTTTRAGSTRRSSTVPTSTSSAVEESSGGNSRAVLDLWAMGSIVCGLIVMMN